MKKEKILLIIPAYNESEGIVDVVAQVAAYCQKSPYHIDYLVINDGSTDNEEALLLLHKIHHVELVQNLGIGGAVQTGYCGLGVHRALRQDAGAPDGLPEQRRGPTGRRQVGRGLQPCGRRRHLLGGKPRYRKRGHHRDRSP